MDADNGESTSNKVKQDPLKLLQDAPSRGDQKIQPRNACLIGVEVPYQRSITSVVLRETLDLDGNSC